MPSLGLGLGTHIPSRVLSRLLLDQFGGAAAAYSLRKLSASTTNVVRVRRSSDNAEDDFTAAEVADGTLTTWVGANDGFVRTWYDQSGNARDAGQAVAASQPQIVSSGSLITGGIDFDGTDDFLADTANNPFTYTGSVSLIAKVKKNATAYKDYEILMSAGTTGNTVNNSEKSMGIGFGNNIAHLPRPTLATDIWRPSGVQKNGTVSTNTDYILGYYISNWSTHRSTGLSFITENGVDVSTKIYSSFNPTSLNTNPIKIGCFDTVLSSSFFGGTIAELIAYPSDQSANRTAIESNINDRYSIY